MPKLHLMKASLDMVNLARYGAEQSHSDPDRTAHCLMTESFGKLQTPKPFVIKTRVQNGALHGMVLAYTALTAKELRETAERHQRLAHAAVMDPNSITTVGAPCHWTKGQSVLFEVRVRPTKRSSSRDAENPGSEQDVYLASPEEMTRAETYCRWLSEMMRRQGGLHATPESMTMTQFAMRRVRRQNSSHWIEGPDATITGEATVVNPERMTLALSGGIGRHKGYGYGMLLLRPNGKPVNDQVNS